MNVRECKQIVVSFWWHCRCSDTRAASHLVFTCGRIDRDLIHTGVYLNIYTFSVNRRKLKKLTQNFLNTDTHVSLADRVRAARWIDEIFSPILSIFGIWTEPRTEKKKQRKIYKRRMRNRIDRREARNECARENLYVSYRNHLRTRKSHKRIIREKVMPIIRKSDNEMNTNTKMNARFSSFNVVDSLSWRNQNRARNVAMHTAHSTHTHTGGGNTFLIRIQGNIGISRQSHLIAA